MFRIGTVNIDTSHAPSFAEILLKGSRARYTAIYNDGFRTDEEVNDFIKKYKLEKRYYSLDEMAKNIDIAFIQSCNWDRHIELSEPFIKAGVPVFIDKPLAGNIKDLKKLAEYGRNGAVILGTSAMRYTYEHDDFFSRPESERGKIMHISASVGVDEFNYAIHAVESITALVGSVRPVSTMYVGSANVENADCDTYFVKFDSGVTADYHICKKCWQPDTLTVVTTKNTFVYKIDSNKVYEAMLKHVCAYMEGDTTALCTLSQMEDSVLLMLAGKKSRENGGKEELIKDLTENDPCFDGYAFEKFYAAQQRK